MSTEKHCPNCADQTGGRKTPHTHRDGKWKCGLCGHETAKRTYNSKKNRDMEDLIKNLQTEGVLKKIFGKKDKRPAVEEPKERFPSSHKANDWMSQKVAHYERHKPNELHHLFSPASGDYMPASVHVGSSWKKEHEAHYNELKKKHPEAVAKAKEMTTGIAGRVSLSRVGPNADFHGMSIHEDAVDESLIAKVFGKKEKKKSRDEILRDKHRAMSDSELKAHAAELKSSIPRARAQGSLVGGAVRDTWQSAQNEIDRRARIKTIGEDAPANAVGGGNIAGMGVGSQGEPGVRPKALKRYKDKNAAEAPDPVMTTSPMRRSFKQFIKGK